MTAGFMLLFYVSNLLGKIKTEPKYSFSFISNSQTSICFQLVATFYTHAFFRFNLHPLFKYNCEIHINLFSFYENFCIKDTQQIWKHTDFIKTKTYTLSRMWLPGWYSITHIFRNSGDIRLKLLFFLMNDYFNDIIFSRCLFPLII